VSPDVVRVMVGETYLTDSGNWREIDRLEVYSTYNTITHENDIALIRLTQPYDGQSIPLAGSATVLTDALLEVTGWGATSEGGPTSKQLMLAFVPYVDNNTCNQPSAYHGSIEPTMMCAGAKDKDSCQGDSGGPLMLRGVDGVLLVGIVSFGDGCAQNLKYGVYTRVSAFRDWVDGVLRSSAN